MKLHVIFADLILNSDHFQELDSATQNKSSNFLKLICVSVLYTYSKVKLSVLEKQLKNMNKAGQTEIS